MKKVIAVFKYLSILSVMIMGFNQSLITLVYEFPYQTLDVMTIGAGLFILLVGINNLITIVFCNRSLLTLCIVTNSLALLYIILINFADASSSVLVAVIPFILLLIINSTELKNLDTES